MTQSGELRTAVSHIGVSHNRMTQSGESRNEVSHIGESHNGVTQQIEQRDDDMRSRHSAITMTAPVRDLTHCSTRVVLCSTIKYLLFCTE